MSQFRQQGDIGVRCAPNQHCLWFHLKDNFPITIPHFKGGVFFAPEQGMVDVDINSYLYTSYRETSIALTPFGARIMLPIVRITGVDHSNVRRNHFDIQTHYLQRWPAIITGIVAILRQEMRMPEAVVYHHPPIQGDFEQWHVPLLQKLFP